MRKANSRRKQAAVSDGSELRRVDRALQKYKKENASARELLESVRAVPHRRSVDCLSLRPPHFRLSPALRVARAASGPA